MEFLSRKKCDNLYSPLGLTFTDRMSCTYNKGKVTPCTVSSDSVLSRLRSPVVQSRHITYSYIVEIKITHKNPII